MSRHLSMLALVAVLASPSVQAEKVVIYREGQLVNPQDVAAVLGQTRSIRLLDEAPAVPKKFTVATEVALVKKSAPVPASSPAAQDASALSLPVRFSFDSAEILPPARAQLDALADGIKLLPPRSIVTVEGHTDAVGSDAYNLDLSRSRAQAVRDYLVQRHGIDVARLKAVGYGEDRPLEDADPYAAVNRRVQFRGG